MRLEKRAPNGALWILVVPPEPGTATWLVLRLRTSTSTMVSASAVTVPAAIRIPTGAQPDAAPGHW